MSDYDTIIIGAGIIGAATALAMARDGKKTLSIDKLPSSGYGSTSASCAIIRPYYSTVFGSAIAHESHFYWSNWEEFLDASDERGLATYNNCGCLVVKTNQNDNLSSAVSIMDEIGAPHEHLNREQYLKRMPMNCTDAFYPAKRPDDEGFGETSGEQINGAIFFPGGGYVSDPQLATHNLQRAAEKRGATFLFNATVQKIDQRQNRITGVTLADGSKILAPIVINAAGPHSAKINQLAGVLDDMNIHTRALRHEVTHAPAPEGFYSENSPPVCSDNDICTYLRPEVGNELLIGSEDPECDEQHWVDPDNYNKEFTEQNRVQAMRMAQRIPALGIPNTARGVVSLYDVTPDWMPIYDRTGLDGYYLAIGTSGNQFKNAPIVGEMMAKLVDACESGHNHDSHPIDFHLKYIDRTVSLGHYSRNREVNPNSSCTVLG